MSLYKGKVKRFGKEYAKKTERQVTDSGGVLECPCCKKSIFLEYIEEYTQLGFEGYNLYHELYNCTQCDKGFCIVTVRKGVVYFAK